MKIEDYGLIGNTITAALVSRHGSIDWLCLPAFDDDACFASLLGAQENGFWQIAPTGNFQTTRRYRPQTTILETVFETEMGRITLTDFMPLVGNDTERADLVRVVSCDKGRVDVAMRMVLRFDYGSIVPWIEYDGDGMLAVAGPDAIRLYADMKLQGDDKETRADFTLKEGECRSFCMTWFPSHHDVPSRIDVEATLAKTESWWQDWIAQTHDFKTTHESVLRSLITLKAMTFHPTGAIVAAPTCSLPEQIGGPRNWDYRYCWIRDATLTLYALLNSGFTAEAAYWRRWLLRAAAGEPSKLQIMYGLHGERRLTEILLPWLAGYEDSKPVRIGNEAHTQIQLDVYGELMDTLHVARKFELERSDDAWELQKELIAFVESVWNQPDDGIWEVRGGRQHFTHSKIMAWVAIDRAIKAVEHFGLDGPVDHWKELRDTIHADICAKGFSQRKGCFTQTYGGEQLDASLLLMAQLGFVSPDDPRFVATVEAIEKELLVDGFVLRYRTEQTEDGLPGHEGAFLACSFWLVDAYALIGRYDDAVRLFNRLLDLRNDLGLLSEEYDPIAQRQLGNFPQAFSHIALINSAHNLMSHHPPAKDRADGKAGQGSTQSSSE